MTTTSAMTQVVATGTAPPAVTLAGLPLGIVRTLRIEARDPGALGVATFRWRPNADADWSADLSTAASVDLTGSGLTATFASGTYTGDDVYEASARSRFAFGGVEFPLSTRTGNTLLRDADPALYWVGQFLRTVLETHFGDRLRDEATTAGVQLPGAVVHLSHVDPGPHLWDDVRKRFPLLALYRTSEVYDARTTVWEQSTSTWEMQYILPAMGWDPSEKLMPLFALVPKVVIQALHHRSDRSFRDGADVGTSDYASFTRARLLRGRYGRLEAKGALWLPVWYGTLEVVERARKPSPTHYEQFGGAGVHEDQHDPADGDSHTGDLTDAVVFDTAIEPVGPDDD
jgi:hypothetical protein